jgi:LuxR family transcriptional regulator, glucitol operon activator
MAYSPARLTLYAIVSAVEEDLRLLIASHILPQIDPEELMTPELAVKAQERATKEYLPHGASVEELIVFLDFVDHYELLNRHKQALPDTVSRYLKTRTSQLERLAQIRNRVAHSRPLQVDDLPTAVGIAEAFVRENEATWPNTHSTLQRLRAEPSFVLKLQIRTYGPSEAYARHNLPTPDFDETGFVGRARQAEDLKRLCLGPYPVISILGEGGIGKTALVLKVAHDILELPERPFDAVVWTSAKTAYLTPDQIVRIHDDILGSLGMLGEAAAALAGATVENPLEEIVEYLSEFRVLLILDNVETVLDERLRSFLERLPPGSKVLITSRIGLGAFEYPVKLEGLEDGEAVQLIRNLARVRGVERLVRTDNKTLSAFCRRMQNNPGYIKWFVSTVQVGRRPEEVLEKSGLFLDFCLSNVYNYLGESARRLLESLVSLPGPVSQGELAVVNEMRPDDLQRALSQLLTTNMVVPLSVPHGTSYDTHYQMSDLARQYVLKHHPVDGDRARALRRRHQKLVQSEAAFLARAETDPYSLSSLTPSTRGQLAVSKLLFDALAAIRQKRFDEAESLVEEARLLAPGYFEVHRIDALLRAEQGDVFQARTQYEAAIEMEPDFAPLRRWYGGFLLRYEADPVSARREFEAAVRLDPYAPQPQLELIRSMLFLRAFEEARSWLDKLLQRDDLHVGQRRILCDLEMRWFQWRASELVGAGDWDGALDVLEAMREAFEGYEDLSDPRLRESIGRSLSTAGSCLDHATGEAQRQRARSVLDWIANEARIYSSSGIGAADEEASATPAGRLLGRVRRLVEEQAYGFIRTAEDSDYFFHQSGMKSEADWLELREGSQVEFTPTEHKRGSRAIDVELRRSAQAVRSRD